MRTKTAAIAALVTACAVLPAFSVVLPSTANAQPASATPSPADVTEAKARFEKGANLFKADKFAEAIEEFRASYARVNSPNSHLYVARCLVKLNKLVEAYLEYEKVAAEAAGAGEKYAQTGETAKTERDELNAKLAMVSVTVSTPEPGAKLTVGGTEVPQDRWGSPFPAMPGNVEVRLEAAGKPAATQSVSAAAGESKSATIAFAAPETGDGQDGGKKGGGMSGMRIGSFVAAGVGVAGFALFAIEGSASQSTYDQLKKDCGTSPCPADRADDIDKGKSQQMLANIGLGIGAVGIAAGATLFVLSLRAKKTDTEPQTSLVVGPTSLGVRGTF